MVYSRFVSILLLISIF